MTTYSNSQQVPTTSVPATPLKKRRWYVGVIIGALFGIALGMVAVSVGSEGGDKTHSNTVFTVWVFGVRVHQETVTHDAQQLAAGVGEWRGPVWGLSLTAAFASVGSLIGAGLVALSNRGTSGAAEPLS